jgi:hypothetical protein
VPDAAAKQGQQEQGDKGADARMSCNEADECSMANKDVKKIWASASAKAGTLDARQQQKQPSNAERRITEQRRAESAAAHDTEAAKQAATHAAHGAAEGASHAADHPH